MEQQVLVDALNAIFGGGSKTVTEILNVTPIAHGATTTLADCTAINMSSSKMGLAITVATTYNAGATQGIQVHVLTSYDGVNYDTVDWDTWTPGFTAGASIQQTKVYETAPAYVKVLIENLDGAQSVTDTTVQATVG